MIRAKMKNPMRIIIAVFISLVIGIAYYCIFYTGFPYKLMAQIVLSYEFKELTKDRERLLCKTDYKILLEACRDILRQVDKGVIKPGKYHVRRDPSPEAANIPKPILDLKPSYIYIDENETGRVLVTIAGGIDYFGLVAYSEDFKEPTESYFEYGDKQLIEGLWYYDVRYRENPDYDKVIDDLINKNKK